MLLIRNASKRWFGVFTYRNDFHSGNSAPKNNQNNYVTISLPQESRMLREGRDFGAAENTKCAESVF